MSFARAVERLRTIHRQVVTCQCSEPDWCPYRRGHCARCREAWPCEVARIIEEEV